MATPRSIGKAPVAGIMQVKIFGLPVDKEFMFSNHKNVYKPRVEKRQRKLITQISFIRPFLEPDENILLVATGHSPPTVLEKIGIGWLFLYLKRSILIFTDRRIFHVPATSSYQYRNSISQIPYASCESIQMKRGSLVVEYGGGEDTEKFISISGREKKKVRELIALISTEETKTGAGRRTHLCPQCASALYESIANCGKCGLRFKTATAAAVFAVLLPGGGYFYLRQPFLGVVTGFLEICSALMIAMSVTSFQYGLVSNMLWLAGGVVLLLLLKAFAVVHARVMTGEFIPRPKEVAFQTSAASIG